MKRRLLCALAASAVGLVTPPAIADRLHLESGGVIETAEAA